MTASHGELGMVSASVVDGRAAVFMIRYSTDPEDGWWLLAAEDTRPEVDNLRTACIHCVIDMLEPGVGTGMDAAKADAEQGDGVGIAAWDRGSWLMGDQALDAIEREEERRG